MLVVKRKNIIIASVLAFVFTAFGFCFFALSNSNNTTASANIVKIVLDAGHGGVDGGVSGIITGVKESEINLKIVKKLQNYLEGAGMSVTLTRNSEAGLYGIASATLKQKDMKKRKEIIEKASPTLVVSVHLNQYSVSTRRGAQVFYKKTDVNGKRLAETIQNAFNEMPESTRDLSALAGDYYILNCTNFPSVIAECGYLSNPEEEALLITETYQDSIAYTLFKGICGYLAKESINYFG